MTFSFSSTMGKQVTARGKVYHKDPGLSRSEVYASDADIEADEPGPKSILISRREPGLSELLTLHPGSHRAELLTQIFLTNDSEPPSRQLSDIASKNWELMKSITADKTMRIGERVINGKPAVGFRYEAPAREILDSSDMAGQVRWEIWVDRDDAVPLSVESEFQNARGLNARMEVWDIQWDGPLNESLFDLSVPEGWSLSRTRIETAEYADTGLAPGVSLQMGPDGQEPMAVAGDVAGVVLAVHTTQPDSNIPGKVQITMDLKSEAAHRLRDYADAHPDKIIVVDFNGEIKVAAKPDADNPKRLTFDLSLLRLSLSELEERYFTTAIERNES